ncbi:MAG: efflux RND transporter periplasmic adaptor subunit [Bacteroidota bacterium]|nr:efflux RND transporter periplasmic adaptor subunit [Bacteroidota bacterium]MDP4233351.1 efflux RND transporter periplasmic adaptor subunit [Bacteroidota bacterium]MDP4242218.1 efflux RND transporter periplasmic adaptor subunit [Bacteroidota bacterium]MDP4286974.1 efflux RND transporter periplasmic adaptor subunit [Bacteroidota bacterium]
MSETNVIVNRESRPKVDGKPTAREVVQTVKLGQKKRNLKPLYAVLALLIVAFGAWYIFFRPAAKAPLVIRYAAVDLGGISQGVTATGTLQAVTTVQVGSQISGMVKELDADYNTKVKKGQVLARLDPATYEANVTQARANVARAQADLDASIKDEARQRQLLARQLIAQADYDASKNKLEDAKASLQQTTAQLKQAEVNLGYTTILSPVDGVVQARNVDRGQTVAAGLNVTTLFVIAEDLTKMQVSANVDEADIGQVQPGQNVKFTVDAYPGEPFVGTVSQVRINPVTQQNVVTYAVIIMTSNPDGKLLPGMTATVTIVNASRENVLRVPIAATRFQPPPEFFTETKLPPDTAARVRKQRAPGDTTRRRMAGGPAAGMAGQKVQFAKVYIKSNDKTGPTVKPVRIVEGLTDANYAEVLRSTPEIKVGDSIVVAAFTMSPTANGTSSPINSRPGMGGGRRF